MRNPYDRKCDEKSYLEYAAGHKQALLDRVMGNGFAGRQHWTLARRLGYTDAYDGR